jgi:hypothetical protein
VNEQPSRKVTRCESREQRVDVPAGQFQPVSPQIRRQVLYPFGKVLQETPEAVQLVGCPVVNVRIARAGIFVKTRQCERESVDPIEPGLRVVRGQVQGVA